MTTNCAFQLTAFEPIVGALVKVERFADGWHVEVRHRHYAGLFADCDVLAYDRLTDDELVDVLCAEAAGWAAR